MHAPQRWKESIGGYDEKSDVLITTPGLIIGGLVIIAVVLGGLVYITRWREPQLERRGEYPNSLYVPKFDPKQLKSAEANAFPSDIQLLQFDDVESANAWLAENRDARVFSIYGDRYCNIVFQRPAAEEKE